MNVLKRLTAFSLGLLTVLVFLEILIRVTGFVYLMSRKEGRDLSRAGEVGRYVVLCLGNSYTLGDGAPPRQSYPAQLQDILEKNMPGTRVKVINEGVGNQNTSELLKTLEFKLEHYSPDLVVLQTGQANYGNYMEYDGATGRSAVEGGPRRAQWMSLNSFLYKSRVYRLAFLLSANLRQRLSGGIIDKAYKRDIRYKEAIGIIKRKEKELVIDKGAPFIDEKKGQELIGIFLDGIKRDPVYPDNYTNIGLIFLFRHELDESLSWFIKAVQINPAFRSRDEINRGYTYIRFMRMLNKGPRDEEINKRIDAFIEHNKRSNKQAGINFLFLTDDEVNAWVESDLRRMIDTVLQKRIRIIVQTFPLPTSLNDTIRKVSRESGVPLVDNEKVFDQKLAGGAAREDLFVPDGHCNARGYGVMAANVYDAMIKAGLLRTVDDYSNK